MLFDPRWEPKNREYQGVSLLALIAWLEKKPADGRYEFENPVECALALFLQETKGATPLESIVNFWPMLRSHEDGHWLQEIARPDPNTFGAALSRARAFLVNAALVSQ